MGIMDVIEVEGMLARTISAFGPGSLIELVMIRVDH